MVNHCNRKKGPAQKIIKTLDAYQRKVVSTVNDQGLTLFSCTTLLTAEILLMKEALSSAYCSSSSNSSRSSTSTTSISARAVRRAWKDVSPEGPEWREFVCEESSSYRLTYVNWF